MGLLLSTPLGPILASAIIMIVTNIEQNKILKKYL